MEKTTGTGSDCGVKITWAAKALLLADEDVANRLGGY